MSNKQNFLIKFSFLRKVKKKSFVISNIVLLLLIVLLSNIDTIIKSFGGDFTEEYTIYYKDDFQENYFEQFSMIFDSIHSSDNEIIILNDSYDVKETDGNIIVIDMVSTDGLKAKIESANFVPTSLYTSIYNSLNAIKLDMTAKELNLNGEDLVKLKESIAVERVILNEGEETNEFTNSAVEGISTVVVLPLFFGLIMIIQMIGLEIFDEKSTKSMEVIMSNVDPKTHLNAKLIATNLFGFLQFALVLIYGVIGFIVRQMFSKLSFGSAQLPFDINISDYTGKMIITVVFILVLYLLTNILYSLVMAILASTANEVDDYQKIISPLMILMLVGFYTAIFSPMFDGAVFSKVMAYIPFFSLMIAPGLFISGDISILGMSSIILVLIAAVLLIYRFGLPVYKQSVLDYSNDQVFKRFINNFKRSKNN